MTIYFQTDSFTIVRLRKRDYLCFYVVSDQRELFTLKRHVVDGEFLVFEGKVVSDIYDYFLLKIWSFREIECFSFKDS